MGFVIHGSGLCEEETVRVVGLVPVREEILCDEGPQVATKRSTWARNSVHAGSSAVRMWFALSKVTNSASGISPARRRPSSWPHRSHAPRRRPEPARHSGAVGDQTRVHDQRSPDRDENRTACCDELDERQVCGPGGDQRPAGPATEPTDTGLADDDPDPDRHRRIPDDERGDVACPRPEQDLWASGSNGCSCWRLHGPRIERRRTHSMERVSRSRPDQPRRARYASQSSTSRSRPKEAS